MYVLKNAWKNIIRNKGRNILIGIIIVVIASATSITLAIRESANDIVESYQEKNNIEVTIGMDRKNLMGSFKGENGEKSKEEMINSFNEIQSITLDEIKSYGNSKYVSSYSYTYDLSIDAENIEEATDSIEIENRPNMPNGDSETSTKKVFNEKAKKGAFTLVGYDSYENMIDFINGNYTIIEGEVSSDFTSNSVVISEELASLNSLSIGDTITLVNPNDVELTYEAKITGIYQENTDSSNDMSSMFSNSANKIITNVSFIQEILDTDETLVATITPKFIMKDAESVDKFEEEIVEKGLSEYYTVTSNLEDIEGATASVDSVKVFATTFLIITLTIGGIVLVVINMINIRERKYEIGVLRTIGMKKSKLSLQFMLELVIIGIVSLMIGSGIGSVLSVPVANTLLENEISNASEEYEDIGSNFGKPSNQMKPGKDFEDLNFGVANIEQVDSINAVVDFKVMIELLGIGILLILFSSMVSMIAIARFSPLTILKERS